MADQINVGKLSASIEAHDTNFSSTIDATIQKAKAWQAEMAAAGQANQRFSLSVKEGENAIRVSSGAISEHTEKLSGLERVLGSTFVKYTLLFGLLREGKEIIGDITRGFEQAVASAARVEDQIAAIRTITGGSKGQTAVLADQLRSLTMRTPGNFEEAAGIATQGAQIGVPQEKLAAFTETVERLTAVTRQSGEATATWLGQFANIAKVPFDQFDKLGDSLAALSNFGASTPQSIQEISLRLAGAGQVAGLSAAEILGWAAAASDAGIESEMAGSAISRTFIKVKEATDLGGSGLRQIAQLTGQTSDEFQSLMRSNPNEAMLLFVDGLKKTKDEGGNLIAVLKSLGIEDIREIDTLLRLVNAQNDVASHTDLATRAIEEGGLAATRAGERWETTASQVNELQNVLAAEGATVASPMNEALGALAKAAHDAFEADDPLYKQLKDELTPAIQELTKAIEPGLIKAIHSIPGAVENTSLVLLGAAVAAQRIANAIDNITTAIGGLPTPPDWLLYLSGPVPIAVSKLHELGQEATRQAKDRALAAGAASYDLPTFLENNPVPPPGSPTSTTPHLGANPQLNPAAGFYESLARAQQSSAVGSTGAAILAQASAARQTGDTEKVTAEVQKLKDAIQKQVQAGLLSPQEFAAMGNTVVQLTEQYITTGEEATRQSLTSYLTYIDHVLGVEVPARKLSAEEAKREAERIAREAKAEAEKLAREQERLAKQHADLVATFSRTIDEGKDALIPEVGKFAAAVGGALSNAFTPEAGAGQGAALGKAVSDLLNQAEKIAIPEATEKGQAIKAAILQAISTKDAGDRAAALALVNNLGAEIAEQSALNPANFARSFASSLNRNTLGSEGAALIEALKTSAQSGTPESLDKATDALARLQGQMFSNQNLTPDQVSSYWAQIMEAVNTAIAEGGDEARATLESKLRDINVEQLLDSASNVVTEHFRTTSEQMGRQITGAVDAANRQISEAEFQLQESIDRRTDRENIRISQIEELRGPTEDIEQARINLQRFREEQQTARQRTRQDLIEERDYARQIADLRYHYTEQTASASFGGFRAAGAQAQQTQAVNDPLLQLHRQLAEMDRMHKRKLDDTTEERTYEDTQRDLTRAEQNKDRTQEKTWAQSIADFRQQQALNVIGFEDDLASQQLAHRIGPGGPIQLERNARIQGIRDTYTEQENQAIDKFNKDLARQLILRNLSINGPEAQQTQAQLLSDLNRYRSNLGLPAQAWPFMGGMAMPSGPVTPSQAVANAQGGGLVGSPRYQSGQVGGNRIQNFYAPVIGIDDAADTLGNQHRQHQDANFAGNGLG